jgi:hypothetical protein
MCAVFKRVISDAGEADLDVVLIWLQNRSVLLTSLSRDYRKSQNLMPDQPPFIASVEG